MSDYPGYKINKGLQPRGTKGKRVDVLDCYVLNDETRVIASGSTTKAIADVERGSLQEYIGQKSLNPFIDKDKILQETIRFTIPGSHWDEARHAPLIKKELIYLTAD